MYFSFTASEIRQWNRTLMLEKFDPGVKYCDKGWDYNRTEIFESAVSRVSCFEVNLTIGSSILKINNQHLKHNTTIITFLFSIYVYIL